MKRLTRLLAAAATFVLAALPAALLAAEPQYVINISVDGLGSGYLNALVNDYQAPNFQRLQWEGAWTNNARNDYNDTVPLPNHTTMLTGRGVAGAAGHNWTGDGTPLLTETLHTNKPPYVASVFDVVHDNGISTALFANKSKFILFEQSYNAANGAPDLTGTDNGTKKIDTYYYNRYSSPLVDNYLTTMAATPFTYSFLHLRDPDEVGHASGWGSANYNNSVKTVDAYLGRIFHLVETSPVLLGKTTIILTADHGGRGYNHSTTNNDEPLNYTIPFYAWGVGVSPGADLYALNGSTRLDPGGVRPAYSASVQPIRNGDIANLSLGLLGLGPIPGSTINAGRDLALQGAASPLPLLVARNYFLQQPAGTQNWTPGRSDVELGFSTISTPRGATPVAAVYNSASSPWWRYRMQSVAADATFAPVDLTAYQDVTAGIDVMIKNVTYDSSDLFRATLTNGTDTIYLADVAGTALNALPKSTWLHYTIAIPNTWTNAVLKISGSSNLDTEAIDFDNVEFYAATKPENRVSGSWTAAAGPGWSDVNNWSGGMPSHAGDTATLGPAGPTAATITLDGSRALSVLAINSAPGYTLTGAEGDTLFLANGINPARIAVEGTAGRHEIAVPVSLLGSADISVSAGTTLVISGPVTGSRGLALSGAGLLVLSGSNGYSGGTAVSGGTLQIADDLALGAVPVAPTTNVALNGGTLQFAAASTLHPNRELSLNLVNTIDTGGNAVTIPGDIVNHGSLVKAGESSLTLTGAQTWDTGATVTIESGTLCYDLAADTLLGGDNTVTINGGTLELAGSFAALADGNVNLVDIVNNSTVGGIRVSGTNQRLGSISGAGSLVLEAGAVLSARSIVQDTVTLVLGDRSIRSRQSRTSDAANGVPEPCTLLLLAVGGLCLLVHAWRRRQPMYVQTLRPSGVGSSRGSSVGVVLALMK